MDYKCGRKREEPIGSGAIESTCRQYQWQFKRPGQFWTKIGDEDLLVERVLVSVYPGNNQAARDCAKKFIAVILDGAIEINWDEVRRLANLPEYRNLPECVKLVKEVADELEIKNPLHPD